MQLNKLSALVVASLFSGFSFAQAPGSVPTQVHVNPSAAVFSQQIETVEELLQIDSKLAIEKAREKAAKSAPPPPLVSVGPSVPAVVPDVFEVIAILGVTGSKSATLAINGKTYHRLVVGASAGGYSLVSIGDGCVELTKPAPSSTQRHRSTRAAKPVKTRPPKRVCFDMQAERDAALLATMGAGAEGTFAPGGTRMTITPLPLPTIPAVIPMPASGAVAK